MNREEEYLDAYHELMMLIRDVVSRLDPYDIEEMVDLWESITDVPCTDAHAVGDEELLEIIR